MRKLYCFLILGFMLALSGCGGGADPNRGAISGRVYVTDGNASVLKVGKALIDDIESATTIPVKNAIVTAAGPETKSAVTGDDGRFIIGNLQPGSYTVRITCNGYQPLELPAPFEVAAGRTTVIGSQEITANSKAWNFLVYLDGDNNLEDLAIQDIDSMEKVGSSDRANVLVLIDRYNYGDESNGDWKTTRLYYVTKDTKTDGVIRSKLLVDLGERDMSDPATLRDFIIYCQKNFPAEHTVLILWNHGGGVWPRAVTRRKGRTLTRGIAWDDAVNGSYPWNCLTTDEVAQALTQASTVTGRKIDIVYTDACLMQMLEVAYEWRGLTDYLVGSEAATYGFIGRSNYQSMLERLNQLSDPQAVEEYVKALVDSFYNFYQTTDCDTTCSAIRFADFNNLTTVFTAFAKEMNRTANQTANQTEIKNAYQYTTSFALDNGEYGEIRDLCDFADEVINNVSDTAVKNAAESLKNAIAGTVFYHRETGKYVAPASYGLAILLPTTAEWSSYSSSNGYPMLKLSQDTEWDEFIQKFIQFP